MPPEAGVAGEAHVDYPDLDALALVAGVLPGVGQVEGYGLAGYVAVGRLGRDDLLDLGYAGLQGEGAKEGHGHVGLDVVAAHVAGVAAVVFQPGHHVGDVAVQVDGDGDGAAGVDRGFAGGLALGHLAGVVPFGQVVEVGAQVGVGEGGLDRGGGVIAALGGDAGDEDEQGQGYQEGDGHQDGGGQDEFTRGVMCATFATPHLTTSEMAPWRPGPEASGCKGGVMVAGWRGVAH